MRYICSSSNFKLLLISLFISIIYYALNKCFPKTHVKINNETYSQSLIYSYTW